MTTETIAPVAVSALPLGRPDIWDLVSQASYALNGVTDLIYGGDGDDDEKGEVDLAGRLADLRATLANLASTTLAVDAIYNQGRSHEAAASGRHGAARLRGELAASRAEADRLHRELLSYQIAAERISGADRRYRAREADRGGNPETLRKVEVHDDLGRLQAVGLSNYPVSVNGSVVGYEPANIRLDEWILETKGGQPSILVDLPPSPGATRLTLDEAAEVAAALTELVSRGRVGLTRHQGFDEGYAYAMACAANFLEWEMSDGKSVQEVIDGLRGRMKQTEGEADEQ